MRDDLKMITRYDSLKVYQKNLLRDGTFNTPQAIKIQWKSKPGKLAPQNGKVAVNGKSFCQTADITPA